MKFSTPYQVTDATDEGQLWICADCDIIAEGRLHDDERADAPDGINTCLRQTFDFLVKAANSHDALVDVANGVLTALQYPRGSEAQVRCLEEIRQDAEHVIRKVKEQQ